MSKISTNSVEIIDKIEQISLLTTYTTQLHEHLRLTQYFLALSQSEFLNISSPPPFINTQFYYYRESIILDRQTFWVF